MGNERRWAQKAEKHNGFDRFVGSRSTMPTAVADPSWGGLGGAIFNLKSFLYLTRHAYARYASDLMAPPLPPAHASSS